MIKCIQQKFNDILTIVITPSIWICYEVYSEHTDKLIKDLLDDLYDLKFNSYYLIINNHKIWMSIGFERYDKNGLRPSRLTILRLHKIYKLLQKGRDVDDIKNLINKGEI